MPKVSEQRRLERRQEIARAALRCIARNGFAATSMNDIIAESGLSAGAIYSHYASKEELVEMCVSELLSSHFLERITMTHNIPIPQPHDVVASLITGIREQVGDVPVLMHVWGQTPVNPTLKSTASDAGHVLRRFFVDYLTRWIAQEAAERDASALAEKYADLYIGILQGYVTQSTLYDDFDLERYLDALADFTPHL